MNEQQFTTAIVNLSGTWLVHHDRPARTERGWRTAIEGDAGFPDLVLAHPLRRTLFAEVKMWARRGQFQPGQVEWLDALAAFAPSSVYLWTERDWPDGIRRCLERDYDTDPMLWTIRRADPGFWPAGRLP